MADQVKLTALSPREAVIDALHRCVLGMDSNNRDLFESSILKTEEMSFIGGGFTVDGWAAANGVLSRVFELVTTHNVSNIRVELKDGAEKASLTCHTIAYHVRPEDALKPEDTSYTVSCLYDVDLVKNSKDDLWKIKRWEIKILWTTGDRAVVHP